jgi:ornithine cyclodeaminase
MQFFDFAAVHRHLPFAQLIDALEAAHRGPEPRHFRYIAEEARAEGGHPDIFIILPAWQAGEGIGVKLVTSFPGNREKHGIPTVNGLYVWIDGETGVPMAVMDGEALIFRKTAADSALGSRLLSRPDSEVMLMVGAGALAPYLIEAHPVARPSLKRLMIWNRTAATADALAARLREAGRDAVAVADLDKALGEADIVISATMATTPIIRGARIRPGTHVELIGSFTPAMREGDDDLLRRADIFVDSYGTTERSGDFLDPFARGVITKKDIRGDYAALCNGRAVGRSSPDRITLLKNGGGSHFDYYTAREVMRSAAAGERMGDG